MVWRWGKVSESGAVEWTEGSDTYTRLAEKPILHDFSRKLMLGKNVNAIPRKKKYVRYIQSGW